MNCHPSAARLAPHSPRLASGVPRYVTRPARASPPHWATPASHLQREGSALPYS